MIRGISLSSVILGEVIDKALFVPLAIALVYFLDESGWIFSGSALVTGSLCTFAGALFAATRAKRRFLAHALLVATITFALSLTRFFLASLRDEPSVHPMWWEFLAWTATFVSGYLAGIHAERRAG